VIFFYEALETNRKKIEQISIKFGSFFCNQDKFGTNCAVDKHTKISVKICILTDIQNVKYWWT